LIAIENYSVTFGVICGAIKVIASMFCPSEPSSIFPTFVGQLLKLLFSREQI
jgi:hypothetical protein